MSAQATAPPREPGAATDATGGRRRRLAKRATAATNQIAVALRLAGPWPLRLSLAVVLIWFGGLKVVAVPTLSAAMIAAISPPFLDAAVLARLVGGAEVLLGLGLIVGRWQPAVLTGVVAQLTGTFLVLLVRPDVALIDGNLLTPTVEGEYVLKNLVLLAGALTLAGWMPRRRQPTGDAATHGARPVGGRPD